MVEIMPLQVKFIYSTNVILTCSFFYVLCNDNDEFDVSHPCVIIHMRNGTALVYLEQCQRIPQFEESLQYLSSAVPTDLA